MNIDEMNAPPRAEDAVALPPQGFAGYRTEMRPKASMRSKFAVVVLLAGSVGGVVLVGQPVGLGFALFAVLLSVVVVTFMHSVRRLNTIVFGSLAAMLYLMSAVRGASWLVALDITAATLLLPLALVDASSFRELGKVLSRWLGQITWALAPVARGLAKLRPQHRSSAISVLRGVLIAALPLLVFGLLFASADRAFSDLVSAAVPDVTIDDLRVRVVVGLFVASIVGALFLTASTDVEPAKEKAERRRLKPAEWITAVVLVDLLFVAFVVIQIAVLFGGDHHVLETAGLTYAEYAREGFYQLLVVAALVLGLIAAVAWWADYSSARSRVIFRCLLGSLGLLTGVVLVSALFRITGLESSFGLTLVRLNGHALTLWIAGLLLIVMAAGWQLKATWLPRALLSYSALALLVFTLANPEGLIAGYNVDRFESKGNIDVNYLSKLSSDATPTLARLPISEANCAIGSVPPKDSALGFNVSRSGARDAISAAGIDPKQCETYRDRSYDTDW